MQCKKFVIAKEKKRTKGCDETFEVLKYLDNELQNKKLFGEENIGFVEIVPR